MINNKHITGIIIAGGKSSRMGSDKGFLLLNDSTFMSSIIENMKPLVHDIIIVSDTTTYDKFGYKRVQDIIKDAGPLAGLYTGLYHSETEYNLVVSCDIPLIKTFVLQQLIEGFDVEFDVIQLQSQSRTMPLIALYKKQCLHTFFKLLQSNERRLRFAVEQLNTKTIKLDSNLDKYVQNINTPEQLNEIIDAVEH